MGDDGWSRLGVTNVVLHIYLTPGCSSRPPSKPVISTPENPKHRHLYSSRPHTSLHPILNPSSPRELGCPSSPFTIPRARSCQWHRTRVWRSRLASLEQTASFLPGGLNAAKYCASKERKAASTVVPIPMILPWKVRPRVAIHLPDWRRNLGLRTADGLPGCIAK
jgi:hypothetical protein